MAHPPFPVPDTGVAVQQTWNCELTQLLEIADRFIVTGRVPLQPAVPVLDVGTKCSEDVDQRVGGGDILGVARATDEAPVFLDQSVGAGRGLPQAASALAVTYSGTQTEDRCLFSTGLVGAVAIARYARKR
jgi:hypothetical protein